MAGLHRPQGISIGLIWDEGCSGDVPGSPGWFIISAHKSTDYHYY